MISASCTVDLRLEAHKSESTSAADPGVLPIPSQLVLPIDQHVGDAAPADCRESGSMSSRASLLAEPYGSASAHPCTHHRRARSSLSNPGPSSKRYGEKAPCIVIECDGEDRADRGLGGSAALPGYCHLMLGTRRAYVQGGIVGLGGAVFPDCAQKLMQAVTCEARLPDTERCRVRTLYQL